MLKRNVLLDGRKFQCFHSWQCLKLKGRMLKILCWEKETSKILLNVW